MAHYETILKICLICLLMKWLLKFIYRASRITGGTDTEGSDCFSLTLVQLHTMQLFQLCPSCEVYIEWYLLCKLNKRRLFIRAAYGIWLNCVVKFQVKPAAAEIELPPGNNVKSKAV